MTTLLKHGLQIIEHYLSDEETHDMLRHIYNEKWDTSMSRRVQHYGYKYNYRERFVSPTSYLGPLPDWTQAIITRIKPYFKTEPDQIIINEYKSWQGIGAHTDAPGFGPVIATLSLVDSWSMRFHNQNTNLQETHILPAGSLTLFSNTARYHATHEIIRGRVDPLTKRARQTRVSMTFRTVKKPGHPERS